MIEEIYIQDLGVIAESRLKFGSGLTVLSGETGAGKTMVLSALGLLLGERSDSAAVRKGQDQAYVEGRWWLKNPELVNPRLLDAGVGETDGELLLNRSISAEGRSRATVGSRSVPVAMLNELGQKLVVVHGQSDQIRLKSASAQREALDQFAGPAHQKKLAEYAGLFAQWRAKQKELSDLVADSANRAEKLEELRAASIELEQLDPKPGEDAELMERVNRLSNLEDLRLAAAASHSELSGEDFDSQDAITKIGKARKALENVAQHDEQLAAIAGELKQIGSTLNDVAADIGRYLDSLDSDGPDSLEQLQARRASVAGAMRKYGPTLDEVIAFRETSGAALLKLENSDDQIIELTGAVESAFEQVLQKSQEITATRHAAAAELEALVTEELHALAMPGASLKVQIEPLPEPTSVGADAISILLSSYPGADARPLGKGASGGELSRIMLAIEVVLARTEQAPTFIFDEVDAGVGGAAAIEIGRRLARLARQAQVIVVTHLAQVAAFADHHLRVLKSADGAFTNSSVTSLTELDRITELARMLSGLNESESARQHAGELLGLARAEFSAK